MRLAQCATPRAEDQPCETWYESSWELQAGLTVFEDVDITIPAELLDD